MSAYEELLRRCCDTAVGRFNISREAAVAAILAEVFRTLETVTEDMHEAAYKFGCPSPGGYLAVLRASPLAPPKDSDK